MGHLKFKFCLNNKIRIIYSTTSRLWAIKVMINIYHCMYTKAKFKTIIQFNEWFDLKYEIMYFIMYMEIINFRNMATVIVIFENYYLKNRPIPVVKP